MQKIMLGWCGDDAGKKDENVVDADFEEVKDENKEKSA